MEGEDLLQLFPAADGLKVIVQTHVRVSPRGWSLTTPLPGVYCVAADTCVGGRRGACLRVDELSLFGAWKRVGCRVGQHSLHF